MAPTLVGSRRFQFPLATLAANRVDQPAGGAARTRVPSRELRSGLSLGTVQRQVKEDSQIALLQRV